MAAIPCRLGLEPSRAGFQRLAQLVGIVEVPKPILPIILESSLIG